MMDDEPVLGTMIRMIIQFYYSDAKVLISRGAREALHELSREDPDIFITEWRQSRPECDEMFRLLAAKKITYPIVVISLYGESLKADGTLKVYADIGLNITPISKPITAEQLLGELAKHLGPGNLSPQFRKSEP